jgi:hypothetical protein
VNSYLEVSLECGLTYALTPGESTILFLKILFFLSWCCSIFFFFFFFFFFCKDLSTTNSFDICKVFGLEQQQKLGLL